MHLQGAGYHLQGCPKFLSCLSAWFLERFAMLEVAKSSTGLFNLQHFAYQWGTKSREFPTEGNLLSQIHLQGALG
jgi:hypothetical protein